VGGLSALVLGTPLATLLGQITSWRIATLAVAGLSLVLAAAVTPVLPPLPAVREAVRSGGVVPTLLSPGLGVVLSVTFVMVAAHFALFTYVEPFAGETLGIAAGPSRSSSSCTAPPPCSGAPWPAGWPSSGRYPASERPRRPSLRP
jgi:predicted MFS family arabinose efflux permease